jgi:hypothetical protein
MLATIQLRTFSVLLLMIKSVKIRIYKPVTLPVVLNGCETLRLKLKEEYRQRILTTGL